MNALRAGSLRTRVVAAGLVVVTVALVGAGLAIYLVQRVALERHLDEVLTERAEVVRDFAEIFADPDELAAVLSTRGIRAEVRTPDGRVLPTEPRFPRVGNNLPLPPDTDTATVLTRTVELPGGGDAVVGVSRDGVDATLTRLLRIELITAVIALPLAALLLRRAGRSALRPLDELVETADGIAAGDRSRRLTPASTATELGRAGAAFDRMLDELEAAVERANASADTTREFLALSAHQLNTPIASASASVQTLLRETSPERREQLLLTASRETARAGRMVHALLRLAHLDQGMEITPVDTDVVVLVDDEIDRAARRALHLDVRAEHGAPTAAFVDPHVTAEVVANLLDNATRHAVSQVTVRTSVADGHVAVTVTDDGPGVPPGDEARIFDRFVSIGTHPGTGLGLPIARGLARIQAGDVTYRDRAFVLSLPRSDGTSPASDPEIGSSLDDAGAAAGAADVSSATGR